MCSTSGYFKIFSTIIFIFLFVNIFSCGTKHSLRDNIIYKYDHFSAEYLNQNTFIVGGISSGLIHLNDEERLYYGSLLTDVLLKKGGKKADSISVISTNHFGDRIGKDRYTGMMKMFDEKKKLNKETMQFLSKNIPDATFILLAYIDNEDIVNESFEEKIKDEDGKEELQITYKKRYYLTVEFQIYDILLEKMVLNNSISNVAKRTVKKTKQPFDGFLNLVEEVFEDERQPPDPAKIKREDVLKKIFEKFAEDLSKMD